MISDSYAQKIVEREIDATNLSAIEINSDEFFSIQITSGKTDKIKIKTRIEGEYYENVVLSILRQKELIKIMPEFSPFFDAKNDKLAAHKVLALEMELEIPEDYKIQIKSDLASIYIAGKFNSINAILGNGNCVFNDFTRNASLKTVHGSIVVYANKSVIGTAISKSGTIINELFKEGNYTIHAESITGDISLFQIH